MKRIALIGLLTVSLVGCADMHEAVRRITPKEADAAARKMLSAVAARDTALAYTLLAAQMRGSAARQGLAQIVSTMGADRPGDRDLVDYRTSSIAGQRSHALLYEAPLGSRLITAEVDLTGDGRRLGVFGFRANVADVPLRVANGFWSNLGPAQTLWLLLELATLAVVGYAIYRVVRIRPPRRWLLVAASLIAVVRFTMNWTTGAVPGWRSRFFLHGVRLRRSTPVALPFDSRSSRCATSVCRSGTWFVSGAPCVLAQRIRGK